MNDLTEYYKFSSEPFKRENLENHPYFIRKKSYDGYVNLPSNLTQDKNSNTKLNCRDDCCKIL